jgi:hypothetical protein
LAFGNAIRVLGVKRYGTDGGSGSMASYKRNSGVLGKGLRCRKKAFSALADANNRKKLSKKLSFFLKYRE